MTKDILRFSSQSERAFDAVHSFSLYLSFISFSKYFEHFEHTHKSMDIFWTAL